MDEAEQKKYVSQLKDVFDSCDTTGTGYLDQEELTELCQKLHLEAQIPLLLQTLLGSNLHARVNFEEFKEGFVAVLSTAVDLSTSEDESSYLEPPILEEVEPKYVRGSKRYGRRSLPEFLDSEEVDTTGDLEEPFHFKAEPFVQTTKRSQLRRSTSLESVESLKSDEELESHKEPQHETFEALGQLSRCNPNGFDCPRRSSTPCPEATEDHVQTIWEELGVGKNGYLNREELAMVCNNIGLKDLKNQEVDSLFRRLDKDGDGKVSRGEFLRGLFRHGPTSSTPCKKKYHRGRNQSFDENRHRTATPSLISGKAGSQLFSALDDGTGYASPEQIINMWQEDGIKNSQEILQTLDFSVEEKVNLEELTNALENELMSSKNGIHLAALTCYKNEIDHLQGQIQQMYKERDKLKLDLDRAEKRNVQLAKEVDDRHATIELLNETKIKHLDQGYKEKMAAVKVQMDKAQELIVQQVNMQRVELEYELDSLRSEEISSREKLNLAMKESKRLQKELTETLEKLAESEKLVCRLQKDLDYMLKDKFGALDNPNIELFGQEERFAEIIMAYEQQCRELRDRNDELQSEMEVLRSQLHIRKHRRSGSNNKNSISMRAADWVVRCAADPDKVSPVDPCANVSIETEIAIEQQRRQHLQEVQDLKIQLETKVNYYEREIELMKRNFEKERKYIEQSFKVEISELEDERMTRSQEMERLRGVVNELRDQQQGAEARQALAITELLREQETANAALREELREKREENANLRAEELGKDGEVARVLEAQIEMKLAQQKRELEEVFERERAEQQQALTKERSEVEQRLSKEKLQLEVELQLQHQKELQQLRKATQDEFNQRLSLLEVEHMSLTEKNQSELIQRHELKIKELMRQLSLERNRWAAQVQTIHNEANKEKQKLQEEQAAICSRFEMESKYKEEIESLKAQVKGIQQVNGSGDQTHWDNPGLCQGIHAQPSTNEVQLPAVLKRKEEEMLSWQQERDELELKLKQVMEESEKKVQLLENEIRNLRTLVTKLEAGNEAEEKYRYESEMLAEENSSLKRKVAVFHQDFQDLEGKVNEQRKQVAWLKDERECSQREFKELQNQIKQYTTEIAQLSTKNLQLSNQNSQMNVKVDASQSTIQLLSARLAELGQQKEEVARVSRQLQETCGSLEKECFQQQSAWESEKGLMQKEMRASQEKVRRMHILETELESMVKEHQTLQNEQVKLEASLMESQEQLLEANTKLMQAQTQHLREVQELKEQTSNIVPQNQLAQLQMKIAEGEQRVRQLQEQLDTQCQEAHNLMFEQQEEYERLLKQMEERMEEVEQKLKNVRTTLQEKMNQLKEQFAKNVKSDLLLKDLYVENAQLMKALQITEQRQKGAEQKNHLLAEKIAALNNLLRKIAPASLS
ncbi:ninein-like protein isoform X2 [Pristis pectinata]|uniref:ninein-like protein isoform X2 n=1 Tax=Pristis pectinata TaxID=685728 RepID=UPI00223E6933|nr:ninein-like protein isoform X2 [Pristis pectinata]